MQRYPMTPEGHKALTIELQELKSVVRPRIIAAIAEARACCAGEEAGLGLGPVCPSPRGRGPDACSRRSASVEP